MGIDIPRIGHHAASVVPRLSQAVDLTWHATSSFTVDQHKVYHSIARGAKRTARRINRFAEQLVHVNVPVLPSGDGGIGSPLSSPIIPASRHEASFIDPAHRTFIDPNETNPITAKEIFQRSNGGMYIAVGTERGFIGAAMTNASHLLLTDYDKNVLLFNRINIALLQASNDRQHYVELRTSLRMSDFVQALERSSADESIRNFCIENRKWWVENVLGYDGKGFGNFALLHNEQSNGFTGSNYLYDDTLFYRLQRLAKLNRIQAYSLSLKGEEQIEELFTKLQAGVAAERYTIGVIDLSNLWLDIYIGREGMSNVISILRDLHVGLPSTILLFTSPGLTNTFWLYFGVSMGYLEGHPEQYNLDGKHGFIAQSMKAICSKHRDLTSVANNVESCKVKRGVGGLDVELYSFNNEAGVIDYLGME